MLSGLMRKTRFSLGQVTQREVSPNVRLLQPAGSRSSATTWFVTGSTRERVVLSSLKSQTLSAVAATDGSTPAVPVGMAVVTLPVLESNRARVLSPQAGTQRLVKAVIPPPQGLLTPVMGSPSLLALISMRSRLSFARFGKRGASVKMIQGGATANSASAFKPAKGI